MQNQNSDVQELDCENCLLVDFWEAVLMASSQEAVIQDLLFRLVSVYLDRLTQPSSLQTTSRRRQLRNAEDLVQWLKNLHFYLGFSDQIEF